MLLGTEIPCYSVAYARGKSLIYRCLCQRKIMPLHSFRQRKFLAPAPCLQIANGVVLIYAVSVIRMQDNAES